MHVICSLESQKGNNSGSSARYINYMTKYSDGKLFNSQGEFIESKQAISSIDINSRGGIRTGESRWYSPVYSFSEDECISVAAMILQKGTIESRKISSLDDLNQAEIALYNAKIIELAMLFQTEMAKNFKKQNLGINDKDDILWYGVIENCRAYTGFDEEVKSGTVKQGNFKKGFNTHIHIVQSRKALNEKRSLISPMANAREKTTQGAGFFRNVFFNSIEQTFDKAINYNREDKKKFEYYKNRKKETYSYFQPQINNSTEENKKVKYRFKENFKDKQIQDKEIVSNSRCVDYFFHLEKRRLLEFDRKKGNNYYFKTVGQKTGSIAVSEKGWIDFSSDESGGIIKAIQKYDKFDWNESISLIKSLDKNYTEIKEIAEERKIILVKDIESIKLINYIKNRGISLNTAKRYLREVHYRNSGNGSTYQSLGFKNNSGGYILRNDNFKSLIGTADITSLNFDKKGKDVRIFEGYFNYLSYLQHNKLELTDDKIIIMNSTSNYKKLSNFIATLPTDMKYKYYGDNDRAGGKVFDKLKTLDINIENMTNIYSEFNDFNDMLVKNKFKW